MKPKKLVMRIADAVITKKTMTQYVKQGHLGKSIGLKSLIQTCDDIIDIGSQLYDMLPECFGDKMLLKSKEHSICFQCCWLSACKKEVKKEIQEEKKEANFQNQNHTTGKR